VALVVLPGLNVVAGPHVLEAALLGRLGLRHQLVGAELLVREHDPHPLGRRRRTGRFAAVFSRFPAARRNSSGAEHARAGGHPPERSPRDAGHRTHIPAKPVTTPAQRPKCRLACWLASSINTLWLSIVIYVLAGLAAVFGFVMTFRDYSF
jgi:hypothetical protein